MPLQNKEEGSRATKITLHHTRSTLRHTAQHHTLSYVSHADEKTQQQQKYGYRARGSGVTHRCTTHRRMASHSEAKKQTNKRKRTSPRAAQAHAQAYSRWSRPSIRGNCRRRGQGVSSQPRPASLSEEDRTGVRARCTLDRCKWEVGDQRLMVAVMMRGKGGDECFHYCNSVPTFICSRLSPKSGCSSTGVNIAPEESRMRDMGRGKNRDAYTRRERQRGRTRTRKITQRAGGASDTKTEIRKRNRSGRSEGKT